MNGPLRGQTALIRLYIEPSRTQRAIYNQLATERSAVKAPSDRRFPLLLSRESGSGPVHRRAVGSGLPRWSSRAAAEPSRADARPRAGRTGRAPAGIGEALLTSAGHGFEPTPRARPVNGETRSGPSGSTPRAGSVPHRLPSGKGGIGGRSPGDPLRRDPRPDRSPAPLGSQEIPPAPRLPKSRPVAARSPRQSPRWRAARGAAAAARHNSGSLRSREVQPSIRTA